MELMNDYKAFVTFDNGDVMKKEVFAKNEKEAEEKLLGRVSYYYDYDFNKGRYFKRPKTIVKVLIM